MFGQTKYWGTPNGVPQPEHFHESHNEALQYEFREVMKISLENACLQHRIWAVKETSCFPFYSNIRIETRVQPRPLYTWSHSSASRWLSILLINVVLINSSPTP